LLNVTIVRLLVGLFLCFFPSLAHAQWLVERHVYTGTITDAQPRVTFPVMLQAGQAVLASAEATSGDLDTVLNIYAPNQTIVAGNDDRTYDDLDSLVGYRAPLTGNYTVEVTRYDVGNSTGDFRLEIVTGDDDILAIIDSVRDVQLSGIKRVLETPNFRVHYTLTGEDGVAPTYAERVLQTAEAAYDILINQMGWSPPPSDGSFGGDGRIDIYIESIDALGYASSDFIVGDNPNSPYRETRAAAGFIQVAREMTFDVMRATIAHELHHAIQGGMDAREPHFWYYESTSSYIETIVFPLDEAASGYVAYNFLYPELCFGTSSDGGDQQYGLWTFIDHLTERYNDHIVLDLWRNIIALDGFAALDQTLRQYNGVSVADEVALYHTRNLARDYDLAPQIDATVFLEGVIESAGEYRPSGDGVQEMAANYYELLLEPGDYAVGIDDAELMLYGLGVADDRVSVFRLTDGITFDTRLYDHAYVMVYNPFYDETVDDCEFTSYTLSVTAADANAAEPLWSWDARHFEPPE
jgi:hypothetical protein